MKQAANGESWEIRPLTINDLDELTALEECCFSLPWSRESYRYELEENKLACYLGCFYQEQLVGFAGCWLVLDEAHVTNVAVAPAFRRQHIGELLVSQLMLLAQARGAVTFSLEARASNLGAIRLYEKLGFVQDGRRRDYYDEPKEDAILMSRNLETEQQIAPQAEGNEYDENSGH